MTRGLKQSISIGVFAIVVISVAFSSIMSAIFNLRTEWEAKTNNQIYFVGQNVMQITAWFEEHQRKSLFISQVEDLVNKDHSYQQNLLNSLVESHSAVEAIFIMDSSARILCAQNQTFDPEYRYTADPGFYQSTLESGIEYLSMISEEETKLVLSLPLRSREGAINGVLISKIGLGYLKYLVSSQSFGNTGHIYIIDQRNQILASNLMSGEYSYPSSEIDYIHFLGHEKSLMRYRGLTGNRVAGVAERIAPLNWFFVVELPYREFISGFLRLGLLNLLCAILALLVARFIARDFYLKLANSLEELTSAAKKVSHGDLKTRITNIPHNELGFVANAFNSMTDQLGTLFNNLDNRIHFEQTIAAITTTAISSDKESEAFLYQKIQQICAGYLDADCSALYFYDHEKEIFVCRNEWYRDSQVSQFTTDLLDFRRGEYPTLEYALSYNKIIRISEDYADRRLKDVYDFLPDDYPDDVYKNAGPYRILKSHDYKAVLVFPLYDEDRFFGIISFISKTNSAMGSQDEQSRQILSGVVTSAILYGRERQFFVEEHERLLTTLLSIGEAVIAVGANETVSLINHVASRLTGFTAEEALGRNLSEIFCTIHSQTREPLKLPTAEAFATQGRIYSAQRSILVNRDGKEYYISDSAAPIITPQKHVIGAVLVFRDETDKVKDEQEQMKVQRLEAISLLSAGIAHDFNNLLTAILGNISLAKELVPHFSEAAKILKSAEISAEKGQEITSQLLLFAKGGVSEKQASALAGIIRNTAGFLMRGCRTALEIDLDPELDGIRMSEGIFNQILSNIIINARQATQNSGSIIISAKNLLLQDNETTSLSSGPYVLIEITDTGEGIQPGDLNRIFDPYFTTKATGTGLGLTSVLAILRNHSGDIKIESQPGKGTKVSIYIPALPGDKVADQHPLCSDEEYRIIILESDPGLQKLWQRALKLPGFEVVLTSSLVDLLEWFKISAGSGNPYHCVFLSFSPLPDREFIDNIILELRKISPNLSLVICSDASSTSENLHFEETENLYILPKPFHIPELRTLVKKLKKHPTPS